MSQDNYTEKSKMALPPVNEQPKIITSGEQFNQFQMPPPAYPQQIQHFQNGSGAGSYPYQPDYNPTIQPVYIFPNQIKAKKERDGLRIPAVVMSILGCFCGIWICGIPAFILAMLPECQKSLGTRSIYKSSIILSIVGFVGFVMLAFYYMYEKNEMDNRV